MTAVQISDGGSFPHATDFDDLLDILKTFLTTDSTLVAASEEWTALKDDTTSVANERFLYMEGPGLASGDEINVNIRTYFNVPGDYYNWEVRGAVNFDTLEVFEDQPGTSPGTFVPLSQTTIPYWMIASGRRFIVVAKVSTVYSTMYGGFILPYALATEYPYPMYIGGSCSFEDRRYSEADYDVCSFWDPTGSTTVAGGYIRHFDGTWYAVANKGAGAGSIQTTTLIHPWERDYKIGTQADGNYAFMPAVVHSSNNDGNVYGDLDGTYFVTGFGGNAPENILQYSGDDYLVVQTMGRNGRQDFGLIKLV